MTVTADAYLYLEKDLLCRAPVAIRVGSPIPTPDPVTLWVTVDLQGHRLWGTGTNVGIFGGSLIINGRVENWADGLTAPESVRNVKLVSNGRGVRCGGCQIEGSYFKNNREGVQMLAESSGTISRSTFVDNDSGATMGDVASRLAVDRSTFAGNSKGIHATGGFLVQVTRSLFRRNQVGIELRPWDENDCSQVGVGTLDRNTFFENGTDVARNDC